MVKLLTQDQLEVEWPSLVHVKADRVLSISEKPQPSGHYGFTRALYEVEHCEKVAPAVSYC